MVLPAGGGRAARLSRVSADRTTVIRPSAVLTANAARLVVSALESQDVGLGGVWNATPGLWQRYDQPWKGSMPAGAKLVGSIAAVYGEPSRYDITIFRVTVTAHGLEVGWSVEDLTDDALQYAGLTLATCPRVGLASPPVPDPFRRDGQTT